MATLGSKPVGTIVKIPENGILTDYIIVHHGNPDPSKYDSSFNNGTWLLRKETTDGIKFNDRSGSNNFKDSFCFRWLNSDFFQRFSTNVQNEILTVKIPHCVDFKVKNLADGLSCKIFLLSMYEVGVYDDVFVSRIFDDGSKLNWFQFDIGQTACEIRVRYANNPYWLRTQELGDTVWYINITPDPPGSSYPGCPYSNYSIDSLFPMRPIFLLPSSKNVSSSGEIIFNQPPTVPSTINLPSTIYGGQPCTISWSASSDPNGNLEGYIVERSYDGGSSWAQIYQGAVTNTSTTIPFGTGTVMVRVCAYDTEGAKSGWRTSANKTVINNRAPAAPASISVPLAPAGGQNLTITWAAASDPDGNLAGYELERQWDGANAFARIYRGAALSHQDNIPKGAHTSVVYRVRSYDAMGALSGYTTSPSRTIDNNTPPVIQCDLSGDLGIKSDGFSVSYTITDAENQIVTVTEKVGNLVKRTYKPTLNQKNTFDITGEYFQKILNGKNTITITAQDAGGKTSVLSLTFTKKVHKAIISLSDPLSSESQIKVCVLSVTGDIPSDATYTIEVTNNGNDTEPFWEDATADIKLGRNHVFTNDSQTNGWAFNFRLTVERGQDGESAQGGYIASIQGGFQ